jgi:hypothetical protein
MFTYVLLVWEGKRWQSEKDLKTIPHMCVICGIYVWS